MWAIIDSNEGVDQKKEKVLDPSKLASRYLQWYRSGPFDIGNATNSAMNNIKKNGVEQHEQAKADTASSNKRSKSNGCLMRMTPLAVWAANLIAQKDYKAFKQAISTDVLFTHPNVIANEGVFVYCAAIGHLLTSKTANKKKRAQEAIDLAFTLAKSDLAATVEDGEQIIAWL